MKKLADRGQEELMGETMPLRNHPYVQFNFLVNLGAGNTGPEAGFQEISGIGVGAAAKVSGVNKSTDVTLKRGVIGGVSLNQWLNQIRDGGQSAFRNVTIQLQNEDHTRTVRTWKLLRARIVKHTSGSLNAKGTDVAMEELTLAYERMEME